MKDVIVELNKIDEKTGKRVLITFNNLGIRCCYVQKNGLIPSRYFDEFYNEDKKKIRGNVRTFNHVNIPVHGGITFCGKLSYLDYEEEFIGIDFGHYVDKADMDSYLKYYGKNHLYKAVDDLNKSKSKFAKEVTFELAEEELNNLLKAVIKYENSEFKRLRKEESYNWRKGNRTRKVRVNGFKKNTKSRYRTRKN